MTEITQSARALLGGAVTLGARRLGRLVDLLFDADTHVVRYLRVHEEGGATGVWMLNPLLVGVLAGGRIELRVPPGELADAVQRQEDAANAFAGAPAFNAWFVTGTGCGRPIIVRASMATDGECVSALGARFRSLRALAGRPVACTDMREAGVVVDAGILLGNWQIRFVGIRLSAADRIGRTVGATAACVRLPGDGGSHMRVSISADTLQSSPPFTDVVRCSGAPELSGRREP